ncbi:ATP-dependent Clp protease adaptor ClpS [Tautonia plasticadhaerens]|uniref:ATP-dependent Clp protease adapter protein ClpS n=1 Tax=Tautonia plasticadhaerens TaxID=2527974 RepID=A0A518HAQ8_9BACT|nr:ATP-dependent Clp protease adaptor ClpS [Tautonia plasticadhaerens]QDV37919.1 ATP-dependent Clp protease adapter protein ClpS [Tautonia plasticadhaerens]
MSEPDHEHSGGTSVAEPVVAPKAVPKTRKQADESTETKRQPPYNVVILNDEEHTFDYVIELLCKLFRHPLATAKELTWRIHLSGRAVVYTTHKELAELKRDQVLAYGPDHRMSVSKGPLGCYIEPAPGG